MAVGLILSIGTGYCVYSGLSTDAKPTQGVGIGSKFIEIDKSTEYRFDGVSWVKQSGGGGGGGGGGGDASPKVGEGKVGSMIIE